MKNLTAKITFLSLIAGALLTIWGLAHMQWPQSLPWSDKGALIRYLSFLVICTVLVFIGSWWSRKNALLAGAAVAVGIALLSGALWPLLVTLWFGIASALLGQSILNNLNIKLDGDRWLTSFLVGAGVFGTTVGLLSHFSVNYRGVYGVALAFPFLLYRHVFVEESKNLFTLSAQENLCVFNSSKIDIAIAVIALFHFCVALMPETGYDALSMHLFVPTQLALRHHWGFDPALYAMGLIPQLGAWIYSIGYMIGGETASRLINLCFILVLTRLCYQLVFWAGGSDRGGKWAALIFLSTPLTYTESSSLFIESVWAAYVVSAVYWIIKLGSERVDPSSAIKTGGLLIGFASAAKAVTLSNLPVLTLLILYHWRDWLSKKIVFPAIVGLLLFLSVGAIPYITAWIKTGNPIFPFFNAIFKSPYFPTVNFDNPLFNSGFTWDLPYKLVFDSGRYLEATNGASGFQWLLLLLPALIFTNFLKNTRSILLFVVGIMMVAITFNSQSYLRYVFPSLVLLTAILGVALSGLFAHSLVSKTLSFIAALTVGVNLLFITAGSWNYRDFPFGILASESARSNYIAERVPLRRAIEFSNLINPFQEPVALLSEGFGAGLNANALYSNWHNYRFNDAISAANDVQSFVNALSAYNSKLVLLDSSWGTIDKRKIVEDSTNKIANFGRISVRTIRPEFLFIKELLKNSDMNTQEGWSVTPGAIFDPVSKTMRVSVDLNASQAVSVQGGVHYLNKVTARCADQPSQGRMQVNWLDVQGRFIIANIIPFDCESFWAEHSMEVLSPSNAATAIVYISGHTQTFLDFKKIGFRQ